MDHIIQVITGIISIASIIAAVTPSQIDNVWLEKALQFIPLLAINVGNAKSKD